MSPTDEFHCELSEEEITKIVNGFGPYPGKWGVLIGTPKSEANPLEQLWQDAITQPDVIVGGTDACRTLEPGVAES